MIQRIQSVFLLIASIFALLQFFSPIAWFYGDASTLQFFVHRLIDHVPGNEPLFRLYFLLPIISIALILIILPLLTIFSFRHLNRQLKMIRAMIFLTLIQVAAIFFFYVDRISKFVLASPEYGFGIFIPLIILVFSFLSLRSVQKDIKLLRSVDRLR
jgi:CDP-diglyceride synthetase